MYKSLAYKEWLKIRWAYLVSFIIGGAVLLSIFINLRAVTEFNKAESVWSYIIFKNYLFFDQINFVPIIIGLVIAIAQFLPEVQDLRLKLTLHLPLNEIKMLLFMLLEGFIALLVLYFFFVVLLFIGAAQVFPLEILKAMLLTVAPWFLTGFAAYFFTAAILVEQIWWRRVVLSILGFGFIDQLMLSSDYGVYNFVLLPFIVFTLIAGYLLILSGFRFKRGAR